MKHTQRGLTLMETIVVGLLTILFLGYTASSLGTFFLRSLKQERHAIADRLAKETLKKKRLEAFDVELGRQTLEERREAEITYYRIADFVEVEGFDEQTLRRIQITVTWSDKQGQHTLRKTEEIARAKNS